MTHAHKRSAQLEVGVYSHYDSEHILYVTDFSDQHLLVIHVVKDFNCGHRRLDEFFVTDPDELDQIVEDMGLVYNGHK